MYNNKGFTAIETIISISIVAILSLVLFGALVNNRGATEQRAEEAADRFIAQNELIVKRKSCSGDSDGDGYGTCALTLASGERLRLNCPSEYFSVEFFGAKGCKEVFTDLQLGMGQ